MKAAIQLIYWVRMTLVEIFFLALFMVRAFLFFAGFIIVILSCILGTSLGLLAGYYGGALDTLIVRFIDIMLAIPNLLLTIVVVSILEPSLTNATLAIAVVSIPSYVRLTRAAVLNEKNRDYDHFFTSGGSKRITFNVYCDFTELSCTAYRANDDGDF